MCVLAIQAVSPIPLCRELESEAFQAIVQKIDRVSLVKLSQIIGSVMRNWYKEANFAKVLVLPAYGALLVGGAISVCASVVLLNGCDDSSPFSVDFANTVTNAGALFACVTDLPAISYMIYVFELKGAVREAARLALVESYHECVDRENLTPAQREEVYQMHMEKLQNWGIMKYYLSPDLLSETGSLHNALLPTLEQIEREIEEGTSISKNRRKLFDRCAASFKQESLPRKIGKGSLGAVAIGTFALSTFLILENIILFTNTPIVDLFSSDPDTSCNESFYLTQSGCLFSSLTAFGAATWGCYKIFVEHPYRQMAREKIKAIFARAQQQIESNPLSDALYRVQQIKLKFW